jgi:uncharacterized iron-regulated membrane protein
VSAFIHRPRGVFARRALFQLHLWTGLLAGVYILVVCVTGAALVFRIDMQRALHPALFTASAGTPADAATILERVRDAFPGDRVSGVDAPTTVRPTYLAYVVRPDRFLTILVDPVSGRVLGELPDESFVRTVQELHFDLLAGRTGRTINGVGAMMLLGLCLSGVIIWWPGLPHWRRGFTVDFRRSWRRIAWDLHSATGICTVAFIAMWAVTGAYFAFPAPFRKAVDMVSPLTVAATPRSDAAANRPAPLGAEGSAKAAPPAWREMIATAQARVPGQHVARVVLPYDATAPFLVMFSGTAPYSAGGARLTSIYLDQYSGNVLAGAAESGGSAGDAIVRWIAPLHVGNFSGNAVRAAWLILGLAPPVMFVTGFTMWWTRVVRPRSLSAGSRTSGSTGSATRPIRG